RPPYRFKSRSPQDGARAINTTALEKPSTVITRIEKINGSTDAKDGLSAKQISETREGTVDKLRRRLQGDLDNIVLMAMRKEQERRYRSVEQFSEDIRRHLTGLPVI